MTREPAAEPIAVIGLAARVPGAADAAAFWRNVRDGGDAIEAWTDADLAAAGIDRALLDDPSYVKAGARMPDSAGFDAAFFGYAPAEVEAMDPQQCVFLECAWSALEDAAVTAPDPDLRIGVFGGANPLRMTSAARGDGSYQVNTGVAPDYLTSRVSYKLNLTGPSITVQTACSTSLVAVVLACQSLRDRRCEIAIAGGVSASTLRPGGYRYQDGGMLSPDGRCRAFDADARGASFGSGVGVVVLERLSSALARGHRVDAIVIGAAVNNDGGGRPGFAAPSIEGQARVVLEALEDAGVSARTIGLVEAHGSGTPLGDPIEIEALTHAFRAYTPDDGFCAIGSVKSNIGHLDAAAGIAGLIKAVLAVKHGVMPAHLHYRRPNPHIDFARSPFVVNAAAGAWPAGLHPRRAGVSAFGLGGTNAHVVIEEPPPLEDTTPGRSLQLLTFSARTAEALAETERRFAVHVRDADDLALADAARTLSTRRAFDIRSTMVAATPPEAADLLQRGATSAVQATDAAAPIFLFSGLGDHRVDMGRALYDEEREFRDRVDECARLFGRDLPGDLRDVLYPGWREPRHARPAAPPPDRGIDFRAMIARSGGGEGGPLDDPRYAHCAIFALQYALARLLVHWGIRPHVVAGHSLGELTAACVAGVFSLDDACRLVARRAIAISELPSGAMLAALIAEADARRFLAPDLSLAAVNAPEICVFSGTIDAIDRLQTTLTGASVVAYRLPVTRAFHSAAMQPAVEPIEALLRSMSLTPPRIPLVSCLTGHTLGAEAVNATYWARHACEPVRFGDALRTLLAMPGGILVEIGPGRALCSFAESAATAAGATAPAVQTLPAPYETGDPRHTLLTAVGRLWSHGVHVHWDRFYEDQRRRLVSLPTYPFERTTFWIHEPLGPSAALSEDVPTTTGTTTTAASFPLRPPVLRGRSGHVPPRNAAERALHAIWQRLLGFDGIGVLDDFFELGGHSLLALQLANELWRRHRLEMPLRTLVERPTIAAQALLLDDRLEPAIKPNATSADAVAVARGHHDALTFADVRTTIAGSLAISPEALDPHRRFDDGEIRAIVPDLIASIRRRFGLRVYPNEIAAHPSTAELTAYLAGEVSRARRNNPHVSDTTSGAKLASAAFILSSVRSGSTLFRVMLAGHPDLFCPPELHLLPYADMAERRQHERSPDRDQGIERAFVELAGIRSDEAERLTEELAAGNAATREVYRRLQELLGARRLVDKSPGNANRIESLESAERDFEAPRYLVLTRHPYAVIESFVRNRFQQLMGAGDLDPFELAEYAWQRSYGNILAFLESIDSDRRLIVPFERLVASPATVMREVCDVLGVGYSDALLHPYDGRRMRDGLGDPNLLDRSAIDTSLADAWRAIRLPRRLGPFTSELAGRLGYELPHERRGSTRRQDPEPRPLVAMNAPCDGDPLFCVHPLDGGIACYVGLARALAGAVPLVGIEAGEAVGGAVTSIEGMASNYLRAVRDRQPHGPYAFTGWSMGGIVAYEMARQAIEAGDRVSLLAVIDSPAPGQREPVVDQDDAYYLAMFAQFVAARLRLRIDVTADALRQAAPADQLRVVQDRLEAGGLPVAATGWVERGVRQLRRHLVALRRYRPAGIPIGMLLFQSTIRPDAGDAADWGPVDSGPEWRHADGVYGWTSLVTGRIERIAVRGAHHTLMDAPHIDSIAGELMARLPRGANALARPRV